MPLTLGMLTLSLLHTGEPCRPKLLGVSACVVGAGAGNGLLLLSYMSMGREG